VFDHPGLRVMAASPEHVFAMKALAARVRDIDDLRLLAGMVGVRSSTDALRICTDFFPDEQVSQRSAAVLRELFD
jgi:predicted nucleotidyltransferase